jgi:hypothetical protein
VQQLIGKDHLDLFPKAVARSKFDGDCLYLMQGPMLPCKRLFGEADPQATEEHKRRVRGPRREEIRATESESKPEKEAVVGSPADKEICRQAAASPALSVAASDGLFKDEEDPFVPRPPSRSC